MAVKQTLPVLPDAVPIINPTATQPGVRRIRHDTQTETKSLYGSAMSQHHGVFFFYFHLTYDFLCKSKTSFGV